MSEDDKSVLANGLKLAVYGVTDVGMNREHNEDCISWDKDLGLVLLADGMGGHNAGEVASEMAVTAVHDALLDVLSPEMKATGVIKSDDAVREAVIYANEEIHEQANSRADCAGMGTTLCLALFYDDKITYSHVGDSRIYRIRNAELKQITQDHSLVQEMVDNGYLSQEEAMISSSRNLITRALGIAPEVEVDVATEDYEKDDIYLLCSDGLSDLVSDTDIQTAIMANAPDLELAANELVRLANEKGGTDNISVILVTLHEAFSDEQGLPPGESQETDVEVGKD
jgi:protein phosphatase